MNPADHAAQLAEALREFVSARHEEVCVLPPETCRFTKGARALIAYDSREEGCP